jgi:hypothetical protein
LTFERHKASDIDGEAHALRRYVAARAAGRTHHEYARADDDLGAWVASTDAEATGRCDGKRYRRIRRPGAPWCEYLGEDTSIAADAALAAFFELHAAEASDWTKLKTEVTRNRRAALQSWRRKGREIIARIRMQHAAGPDVRIRSPLADEFAKPGTGLRSLKRIKRDQR